MSLLSLFKSKRRALELEEEERVRELGDKLLRDARTPWPRGLRLKVTNKDALTPEGRAALLPGDILVIEDRD